jgi:acetylornithine deacetylase
MDVVQLTRDLVAFDSASRKSNREISDFLEQQLQKIGCEVERLEHVDEEGETKVSLVARKGGGTGGLALCSHSDTVPADDWTENPLDAVQRDGRLYGRGSCDMKGPLAATIAAAARFEASQLAHPIVIIVTADEEVGYGGAKQVASESQTLRACGVRYGVIAEPTRLIPVHAHKGGARIDVTAHGRSAHTSTDAGISANFLIAPFFAEMAALREQVRAEPRYRNEVFDPPTNGWNISLDDGRTPINVTAPKTVCTVAFRPMPGDATDELIALVEARAKAHGLESETTRTKPFWVSPDAPLVQAALAASGESKPEVVSYGTDAAYLAECLELVVLGPGDIKQAHTVDEWIALEQLHRAVDVFSRMIESYCR